MNMGKIQTNYRKLMALAVVTAVVIFTSLRSLEPSSLPFAYERHGFYRVVREPVSFFFRDVFKSSSSYSIHGCLTTRAKWTREEKGGGRKSFWFLVVVLALRSRPRSSVDKSPSMARRTTSWRFWRGRHVLVLVSFRTSGSWLTRVASRRSRGWNLVFLTHDDSNCSSLSTRNSPSTVYSTLFFHFNSVRGLKSLYSGETKEETNEMGIQFFVPRRRCRRSRSSALVLDSRMFNDG